MLGRLIETDANLASLRKNEYPGRIIVVGTDDTGLHIVQVAAIMGRSEPSRNRVYEDLGHGLVRTAVADSSKPSGDPALTLYTAMAEHGGYYVVSNGHQTDTVLAALVSGGQFSDGLKHWETESDENHTPRITAACEIHKHVKHFAMHRRSCQGVEECATWSIEPFSGFGRALQTYAGNGKPLPTYGGEPYRLPLSGGIHRVTSTLWKVLNENNRVAIAAKFINRNTGRSKIFIINKYKRVQ